ncbi:MAG: antibiotic biosynthesis monooxygenase [Desulfobacterales bacterium]|nr:antibiotic biosynthesis monooxygenase [Desulfobacterales bacterium]
MQQEIISIVFSFIKPECSDLAVEVYQEAVDYYKELKGCIDVQLFRKVNHTNEFMIISKWRSLEERNKHLTSEFHKKAAEELKHYRQSDPMMYNFEQLTGNDK